MKTYAITVNGNVYDVTVPNKGIGRRKATAVLKYLTGIFPARYFRKTDIVMSLGYWRNWTSYDANGIYVGAYDTDGYSNHFEVPSDTVLPPQTPDAIGGPNDALAVSSVRKYRAAKKAAAKAETRRNRRKNKALPY